MCIILLQPDPFKRVDDDEQAKPEHLMDIPESLDIELEIVDPDEHDYMDILYEGLYVIRSV